MILSTTSTLEGKPIREYKGIVTGETIIGANAIKDFMAGLTDFFGGRSSTYEKVLIEAKNTALAEMSERAKKMGANAVVGIDLDYETLGSAGGMLMVTEWNGYGGIVFINNVEKGNRNKGNNELTRKFSVNEESN